MQTLPSETTEQTAARALERARKQDLTIAARGYRKWDGARVLGVTSASDPVRLHIVTIHDLRLECDCPAARHGIYCMHRALVHAFLTSERYKASDRRIANHEQALHVAARRLDQADQAASRESPNVASGRPVSIFK